MFLNAQSVFTIQCPCSSWMISCFDTFGYILLVARINPHVFLVAINKDNKGQEGLRIPTTASHSAHSVYSTVK